MAYVIKLLCLPDLNKADAWFICEIFINIHLQVICLSRTFLDVQYKAVDKQ